MNRTDSTGMNSGKGVNGLARKVCGVSFAIAMALGATTAAQAAGFSTHHVFDAVSNGTAKLVGSLPANQIMNLDVVLPVRDQASLDAFVASISNPASLNYRNYITPAQFTARFGPTQNDYDTVVQYLVSNGFTITGGSRDAMDIHIAGPVSAVEAAFNVKMNAYQHPTENRVFFSADREPTTSLAISLWHVSGLNNYSIPHPLYVKKSDYAAAHGVNPEAVVNHATTGSGPSASFLGSDMRAAYYGTGSLNGSGQNMGLWEFLGINTSDVALYYTGAKQTNPNNLVLISTDGTATNCTGTCTDIEQTIDTTQAQGMAPKLNELEMFIGSTDTAIISDMTTYSPLPLTISCSWGWTPDDPSTLNPYWEKMATQGQSFFVAAGDDGAWTKSNYPWPAEAAYVTTVGGTDLTTASAGGAWASETAWVDSGGGISPDKIAIPSWQQISGVINSSNKGSTSYRNGPDVAANANFTYYACGNGSCTANEYGGTSFAAPLWGAFFALVNEQTVANGSTDYAGFINNTVYTNNAPLGTTYANTFHDITSGKNNKYSAVTGYDLVTGWGSMKEALITQMAQ
jgi:subtilase family serine protease